MSNALQKSDSAAFDTAVNHYVYTPKVDIWETEAGFNLEVEMPGVDQQGVNVNLEDGILSIIGRIQPKDSDNYEKVYTEYDEGNYERQFQISEIIEEDKIQASIKDGVLEISLPKKEAVKPKQIKVNVG